MPRKLFRKHTGPGTKYPRKKRRETTKTVSRHEIPATAEAAAAVKVARAWLADAGFHEDPAGTSPERIEITNRGYAAGSREHYVTVRLYVPQIDIESQINEDNADS